MLLKARSILLLTAPMFFLTASCSSPGASVDGGTQAISDAGMSSSSDGGSMPSGDGGASACATMCSGACTDTSTDPKNCGHCSNVCDSGQCKEGQCVPSSSSDAGAVVDGGMGEPSLICQACSADSDCGGSDNFCLKDKSGFKGCGMACHASADCPSGDSCFALSSPDGGSLGVGNCFPSDGLCGAGPDGGTQVDAGTGPVGDPSYICQPCMMDTDCGQDGNFCIEDDSGNTFCGSACNTDSDCPSGDSCFELQTGSTAEGLYNCFPSSHICPGSTPQDAGTVADGG